MTIQFNPDPSTLTPNSGELGQPDAGSSFSHVINVIESTGSILTCLCTPSEAYPDVTITILPVGLAYTVTIAGIYHWDIFGSQARHVTKQDSDLSMTPITESVDTVPNDQELLEVIPGSDTKTYSFTINATGIDSTPAPTIGQAVYTIKVLNNGEIKVWTQTYITTGTNNLL